MTSTSNLQTFFNNPSTSRDYARVSSGARNALDKDVTDNSFRLVHNKVVKQYKGKRDPSKPLASVRLQMTDSGGNMLRSYNGPNTSMSPSPEVIDLALSNGSSTSTSTICNEELIASSQMSTSTDASVSSTQQRLNQIENEKRKQLMEAALEAIDKNFPCMTTVDRVMNWKIADDLDEVEEFSSSASEKLQQPYTSYGKMYDNVKEHHRSKDLKKVRRPLNFDIYAFKQKPASSIIKLRCAYGGKHFDKKSSIADTAPPNVFKVPDAPLKLCPAKAPTVNDPVKPFESLNVSSKANADANITGQSSSPTNHRDELFNYLQIDTNISHARTPKSDCSTLKRRSLRVKVQQSAASKSVKYNKEIEIEKKKVDELEQQVKKHLSMSLANGGAACRFGIWGARKFHSKMNSMKAMNKTKHSVGNKETNAYGESQTAASSSAKIDDEKVNHIGSLNGVVKVSCTNKTDRISDTNELMDSFSLVDNISTATTESIQNGRFDSLLRHSKCKSLSGKRSDCRRVRRHSVNRTAMKRRFSDNFTDYPSQFMNATVMLKNIHSPAMVTPKLLRSSSCDLNAAVDEPCQATTTLSVNPNAELVTPTHDSTPFIVIPPESVCSSSAISPYPLTTSESDRNIHSMSSTDIMVDNVDETLPPIEAPIKYSPTPPPNSHVGTTTAAAAGVVTTTGSSSLVRVTYVHVDEAATYRTTPYKSVLLQGTADKTTRNRTTTPNLTIGSNLVSAAAAAAATTTPPAKSTCLLERIDYAKRINSIETSSSQNTLSIPYSVKILVLPKETCPVPVSVAVDATEMPDVVVKTVEPERPNPLKVDNRKIVNNIFKKIRINGKKNRNGTPIIVGKLLKSKTEPTISVSSPSSPPPPPPLPSINADNSSTVSALDEQKKIAISQLTALGVQYSNPIHKRKQSISAVKRFLKLRPNRLIRNIRNASFRRSSTAKGLLHGRRFGTLRQSTAHVVRSCTATSVYNSPTSTSTPLAESTAAALLKSPKKYANENVSSEAIDSTTAPRIPLPNSDTSSANERSSDVSQRKKRFVDLMLPSIMPASLAFTPKSPLEIETKFCIDSPVSSTTSRESADSAIGTSDHQNALVPFGRTITIKREQAMSSNPLNANNGKVLAALYLRDTIIIVQENEVSFWKYPSRIYGIFGMGQNWERIGAAERQNSDIEVESPYQNRICSNEGRPAYVEFRAKQFPPTEARECYLASIYLNVYFIDEVTLDSVVHHVDLDRIMGNANSVRYTVLTDSRYLVMSWTEQAIGNGTKCGLCKYSLAPDLDTLASVRDFASLRHNIKSLACFGDDKLLGFGYSVVTMWDHQTGDLLLNIDIDLPIGDNLGCFLSSENDDKYMFLVQHFNAAGVSAQYLKLMAINLSDCFSWKVVQTHELPATYKKVTSSAMTADSLTVTFMNGESLLLSLFNPRLIYMRDPKATVTTGIDQQQSFVQNDKIFQICPNHMVIKAVYEHFLESDT